MIAAAVAARNVFGNKYKPHAEQRLKTVSENRKVKRYRSLIEKLLKIERSQLVKPQLRNRFRPIVPKSQEREEP
jgi:hypothetical protein